MNWEDKFIAFMSSEWLFNTIKYFSLVVGTSAIVGSVFLRQRAMFSIWMKNRKR